MTVSYVLFMYATVVAYNYNAAALAKPLVPFLDAAQKISGILAFLAYIAGFTSIMSSMIAGSNSQSRLIFNAAREGLLPSSLARLSRRHTPWASFLVFFGVSLAIVYIFGWRVDPVVFFGEIATLGTILIALVYLVSNLALPVYYWRNLREQFSWLRHLVLPLLGVLAIGFPLWALVQPGQPAPFNYFPWIALGVVVLAVIYATILSLRDPGLGERVGSLVADRE
jgi:amino acid transporter